jgi:hypothetical protein
MTNDKDIRNDNINNNSTSVFFSLNGDQIQKKTKEIRER